MIKLNFYVKKNIQHFYVFDDSGSIIKYNSSNKNYIVKNGLIISYQGNITSQFMDAKLLVSFLKKNQYCVYRISKDQKFKKIKKIPVVFRDSTYAIHIFPDIDPIVIENLIGLIPKELLKNFINYKQYSKKILDVISQD